VKEMWEKNATQKDMLDGLRGEGFQISDRELVRLRSRFKWFLRESRSRKEGSGGGGESPQNRKRGKGVPVATGSGLIDQLAAAILQDTESSGEEESDNGHGEGEEREDDGSPKASGSMLPPPSDSLDPVEALRRELRQQQLQVESDSKWRERKRRRRTRGWAGLPADAPGEPPRFPSETTLDESKAYLGLDNALYAQIRDDFQALCRASSILKKTAAGPETWASLLQRLVRENTHLTTVFAQQAETLAHVDALWKPKTYKTLALDVICQDVTKRMRVLGTRMSIPEAKNALMLNPSQTREVKRAFFEILKADHFTNKFEVGGQHWDELKRRWIEGSEALKNAVALDGGDGEGTGDGERARRLRAVEVLARDVMKRLRAEHTRLEKEGVAKAVHRGPGPGPAPPSAPAQRRRVRSAVGGDGGGNEPAGMDDAQLEHAAAVPQLPPEADLQIDPSLLLAASSAILPHSVHNEPLTHPVQTQNLHFAITHDHPYAMNTQQPLPALLPPAAPSPLPIYFRLHPHSMTSLLHKTVWLSVLHTRTVEEVRRLAAREHPGTYIVAIEGVVGTGRAGEAGEVCVRIDGDDELGAYLGHVLAETGGGMRKAVFVVRLGIGRGM
jgi:hypothetical protein